MTDEVRDMTMKSTDSVKLMAQAISDGMEPMIVDGRKKIAKGLTSEVEMRRVLHDAGSPGMEPGAIAEELTE